MDDLHNRAEGRDGMSHRDAHKQPGTQEEPGGGDYTMHARENMKMEALARELWRARGCPQESSDEDWFRAAELLRRR